MRGEAIAKRSVDSPKIVTPAGASAHAIRDSGKELLIPAHRAKELRSELVFPLKVVSKGIRVSYARNLEADFVKLRPELQMMKGITDILAEKNFMVIANVSPRRQRRGSFRSKISPIAGRDSKIPGRVRLKANSAAHGGILETNLRGVPVLWP